MLSIKTSHLIKIADSVLLVQASQEILNSFYLICKCIIGLCAICIQMPKNALAVQLWQTF